MNSNSYKKDLGSKRYLKEWSKAYEYECELEFRVVDMMKQWRDLWLTFEDKKYFTYEDEMQIVKSHAALVECENALDVFRKSLLGTTIPLSYTYTFQCKCGLVFSLYSRDANWNSQHKVCCPECSKQAMRISWVKPSTKSIFQLDPFCLL